MSSQQGVGLLFHAVYAVGILLMFLVVGPVVKSLSRHSPIVPPTDYHQGVPMASASLTSQIAYLLSLARRTMLPQPVPIQGMTMLAVLSFLIFSIVFLFVAIYIQRIADSRHATATPDDPFRLKEVIRLAVANNTLGFLPLVGFNVVRGL